MTHSRNAFIVIIRVFWCKWRLRFVLSFSNNCNEDYLLIFLWLKSYFHVKEKMEVFNPFAPQVFPITG